MFFIEELKYLLNDSANLQVRSDVPVGGYLSGGLDSSLVCALASKKINIPMPTFHGKFEESPSYDESSYAKELVSSINGIFFEVAPSGEDFVSQLPNLIYSLDEPLAGPGLFPQYAVSKLANGSARQLLQTASNGSDVEFTSNIDIPGTLDVTGAATFDSTLQVDGVATFNDNIVMEGTSADAHELTLTCNPTSDVTVTLPDATTTVAGLAVAQSFTKAQRGDVVSLTDAATIAVDLSLGNNFAVQLGGNRTLGDPTNVTAGQSGVIVVTQDGTGSRTLAYAGTKWKFAGGTAPTLTAGSGGAVDVLAYYVESATRITVTSLLNVS